MVTLCWRYLFAGESSQLANVCSDLLVIVTDWVVRSVLALIGLSMVRRSSGFFGLRRIRVRDVLTLLGLFVSSYIAPGIVMQFLPPQASLLGMQSVAAVPFVLRPGLVLTAGIGEEIIYRGFALEELADWPGSAWLGALLSSVVIVIAHTGRYGFTSGLVIPAIVGAALMLLYVWRRKLLARMLMHALFDGLTIFLLPALLESKWLQCAQAVMSAL